MLLVSSCGEEKASVTCEDVIDLCANFIVLDLELDVFRFAHLSVREVHETRGEYDYEQNHALAARCCLTYLSSIHRDEEMFGSDEEGNALRKVYSIRALEEASTSREGPIEEEYDTDSDLSDLGRVADDQDRPQDAFVLHSMTNTSPLG